LIDGLDHEIEALLTRWIFKGYFCIDVSSNHLCESLSICPLLKRWLVARMPLKESERCETRVERWDALDYEILCRWLRCRWGRLSNWRWCGELWWLILFWGWFRWCRGGNSLRLRRNEPRRDHMECDTDHDKEASNNRRLPLSLRRDGNSACELTCNGEEQERDTCDYQKRWDWRILQRSNNTVHHAPTSVRSPRRRREPACPPRSAPREAHRDYNAE
jgi:hypothetical protein